MIVPVFKVEEYLEQCLNSILCQTYRELEILLIDDGSPDRCGEICDQYAAIDSRIQVFHTKNRGLSAARNLGIDHAEGEYLSFVDSDDWIEPDMYERLLKSVKENKADIGVCGLVIECHGQHKLLKVESGVLNRREAVSALVRLKIRNAVWDKLWRRECFENIRFPEGRVYEDISTTYQIFLQVDRIVCLPDPFYHYRIRYDSISHDNHLEHLVDYYKSTREEYENIITSSLVANDEEIRRILSIRCGAAASQVWSNYLHNPIGTRRRFRQELKDISRFIKIQYPLFGPNSWPFSRRVFLFLCRYNSLWSFTASFILGIIRSNMKRLTFSL